MKMKFAYGIAASLCLLSNISFASVLPLSEVTVKAGSYNSIGLDSLKEKYVYNIDCTVTNVHHSVNLAMGVEQRFGTPKAVLLNGVPLMKSSENDFYQGHLGIETNKL